MHSERHHRSAGVCVAALLIAAGAAASSCGDTGSPVSQASDPNRVGTQSVEDTPRIDHPLDADTDEPLDIAAESGPPLHGLHGWRSSGVDGRVLTLEDSRKPGFERRVTELVGRDPFQIATVAGVLPISRGIEGAFAERLASAETSPSDALIGALIPALPAQQGIEEAIQGGGVQVLGVLPPNAYIVKGNAAALARLAQEPTTYWLGQIPWELKIDPLLASELDIRAAPQSNAPDPSEVEAQKAMVILYDRRDEGPVRQAVERLGGRVERFDDMLGAFVCAGLDATAVTQLAAMQEVSFIDARRQNRAHLQTSVDLCGNHDFIRDTYTYGANVILGMIDSGFQYNHTAFAGHSPYPVLYVRGWNVSDEGDTWSDNPTGHGTHVAGILLSRWGNLDLDGVAPYSGGDADHRFRVVRTGKDSDPGKMWNTDQAIDLLTSDNGAEVINCSWGSDTNTGTNYSSVKADAAVWQTKQIYVFSAGNNGPGAMSIGSPGAAKNVITVGNVNNGTLELTPSSSEGPTSDGRAKPDIYAPGSLVTSADSKNLQGSIDKSGTSMAAPHVTGFLGTLLDHYPHFVRRPAKAKAALMARATRKSWLPARTGVLNSYETHFSTATTQGFSGSWDTDPRPFPYTYWDITIPSGVKEGVVVLSWIEPAPAVGAAWAVFNNVDLWVDYNKDDGDFGEWSSTSTIDNVEVVHLQNPPAGDYRIKARNVSTSTDFRTGFVIFLRK